MVYCLCSAFVLLIYCISWEYKWNVSDDNISTYIFQDILLQFFFTNLDCEKSSQLKEQLSPHATNNQ